MFEMLKCVGCTYFCEILYIQIMMQTHKSSFFLA